MSYGTPGWQHWTIGEDEAIAHIKAAYDLGINTFDTANCYSNGMSEIILGKAIQTLNLPRDEIVVMTKVGLPVEKTMNGDAVAWATTSKKELERRGYANQFGLSRKHIFDSIKRSLERLQLEYVDVLQCHRFDPETPIEETMQALDDVVKAGYARYIGMSSCYAWQFYKMQNYARSRGLTEFISMQNLYSACYREEEREMVPVLQDLGVGMIPWSVFSKGFLCRPVNQASFRSLEDKFYARYNPDDSQNAINERIAIIAEKRRVSMAQVALAWALSKPFMTAPVIGTTSVEKLVDLCAGVHLQLTEEEISSIDEPYRPRNIMGH
ncbi:hypothetical protein FS837_001962 [Tulasnella sp. UAMH 9824]|nr:hypothetical protein FS837_001962 [Tulasnella sp. UAMH 9824]